MAGETSTTALDAPTTTNGPTDTLFEVIDGEVRELPPMGVYEVWIASELVRLLGNFAEEQDLGRVASEMLFDLRPHVERSRRPDVAFVSFERWPRDRRVPRGEHAWQVVPDLAVEVVSPNDRAVELLVKIQEYFRSGVRLVWVLDPEQGHMCVSDSPTSSRILIAGQDLDGGDVLPGFRLPLSRLLDERGDQVDSPASEKR